MKTQNSQIVRYRIKKPGIYQSEHEPFLPGNIAKRGVIETISRKAISPLTNPVFNRRVNFSFLLLKIYSYNRKRAVAKFYRKQFFERRKPEWLSRRDSLFFQPEDYVRYN